MRPAPVFAVVGPSGVGKDTLIRAAALARPRLHVVRRVITRPESAGGEDFEGVDAAAFAARAAAGGFVLSWQAHGLSYGIPASVRAVIAAGRPALFNGSRAALPAARACFPTLRVIAVTARPETLASRLAARGREAADEIGPRLARAVAVPAPEPRVVENDGPLEAALAAFLAILDAETG